jgi:papain like protease
MKKHFQSLVKDQGDRPTCVAFAIGSLHEYWLDISSAGNTEISIDLSEEFLYFMCKRRDGLVGVAGTTIVAAKSALAADGHCLEALYPYQKKAKSVSPPSASAISDGKKRKLSSLAPLKTEMDILDLHFRQGLPVVGVIELFRGAYRPVARGVLPLPSPGEKRIGKHAVLLLESEPIDSEIQFVFLNSWGATWGDGGFGRLTSEYFTRYCKELWSIDKAEGVS